MRVFLILVITMLTAACFSSGGDEGSDEPDEVPTQAPVSRTTTSGATFQIEIERSSDFIWPSEGAITSYFGFGHPTGIDLALDASSASPIRASADGTVSFAGGDPCCEYGLFVVIDHEDGMSTLYGHLSEIFVSQGQSLRQGDLIAYGGATGDTDGKHLHFEIRSGGDYVDPLRYLSAFQRPAPGPGQRMSCPADPISIDLASSIDLRFFSSANVEYQVDVVSITARDAQGPTPTPQVEIRDNVVHVETAPAPAATGQTSLFDLEVTLRQADLQRDVTCQLYLTTRATLPNSQETIDRYLAQFFTPTPEPAGESSGESPQLRGPTSTPTPAFEHPRRPTSTPAATQTPKSLPTPKVFKTPTPRPPPGQKTATPAP